LVIVTLAFPPGLLGSALNTNLSIRGGDDQCDQNAVIAASLVTTCCKENTACCKTIDANSIFKCNNVDANDLTLVLQPVVTLIGGTVPINNFMCNSPVALASHNQCETSNSNNKCFNIFNFNKEGTIQQAGSVCCVKSNNSNEYHYTADDENGVERTYNCNEFNCNIDDSTNSGKYPAISNPDGTNTACCDNSCSPATSLKYLNGTDLVSRN
jgi:hypothetical protein